MDQALEKSARYLINSIRKDGMFRYRMNMNPKVRLSKKYNILRHAGTIYALCMYYEKEPGKQLRYVIEQAGSYLRDSSLHPIQGKKNMMGIWSKPEVNGSDRPLQVKLGGAGLGLVALLSIEKISPGFTPLEDLKGLGRFIRYMQRDNGSLYSKYIPSMGGRRGNWESLYYPGEAALGLVMLHEKDPTGPWLQSAYRILAYLARIRENSTKIPADHWALLATEKILTFEGDAGFLISRELLTNHAIQICETILRDQVNDPDRPEYDGGFTLDGRTTPTATRMEGLLATLSFLPENRDIRKRIRSSVNRGISFLLRAQVREGVHAGAFPRAIGKKKGDSALVKKFNRRVTEVRIDYVQHAMSALIQYRDLLMSEEN